MKNLKLVSISFVFMISLVHSASAQSTIVKLSPQHFIVSTFKLDFEHGFSPKSSILVSPSFTILDQVDEKITGASVEVGKRFYMFSPDSLPLSGFYSAVNFTYGYYDTQYKQTDFTKSYYDSLGYLKYPSQEHKENIKMFSGDFSLGYQISVKNLMFVDFFFGGGVKYGVSSRKEESYYNDNFIDFAYKGIYPKAGFRIGMRI